MAKTKKNDGGPTTQDAGTASPRKRGALLVGAAAALVLVGGGYMVLHRRNDPAREWAHHAEAAHSAKMEGRLTRCFGGADATAVRRLIPPIRQGSWPAPFRQCSGAVLSEMVTTPMDVLGDIVQPPTAAEPAQQRLRDKLDRLRASFTQLQRTVQNLDRNAPVPDANRDRIASALEDVAVDVDAERTAFRAMTEAAEGSGSWW